MTVATDDIRVMQLGLDLGSVPSISTRWVPPRPTPPTPKPAKPRWRPKAKLPCSTCGRPAAARGLCDNCWSCWSNAGKPDLNAWLPTRRAWLAAKKPPGSACSICGRPARSLGYCINCYTAWKRSRDQMTEPEFVVWRRRRLAEMGRLDVA